MSLGDVLALPGLGLQAIGTLPAPEVEVRWAHVTELADPTPWLLGGELVLTTGINIDTDPQRALDYCTRLANAGVAALGLSTGRSLSHESIPESVTEGAQAVGLALVHVPERTLLQSVVQSVSDALHEERNTPLLRALTTQRELSAAAAGKNGIAAVLKKLASTTGFRSIVYDVRLRTVASVDDATEIEMLPLKDELLPQLAKGLRWSLMERDTVESLIALPLGTEGRMHGVLAARREGKMDTYDRAALAVAVSLLSVLLELREAYGTQERARTRRAMNALLSSTVSTSDVVRFLAESGLSATRYQVLVIDAKAHLEQVTALVATLNDHFDEIAVHSEDGDETVVLLCGPHSGAEQHIGQAVTSTNCGPAGLGDVVSADSIRLSVKQARFARASASARGVPLLRRSELAGHRALLTLGAEEERRAVSDDVLGGLDQHDPDGDLYATLAAYVGSAGSMERTAEQLGMHRHTIRARIRRIATLIGRDPAEPTNLFELWLAVELRALDGRGDDSR